MCVSWLQSRGNDRCGVLIIVVTNVASIMYDVIDFSVHMQFWVLHLNVRNKMMSSTCLNPPASK